MFWAIELEVGFQRWRTLVSGFDTYDERVRWLKMCHRLGEQAALDIVCRQQLRTWRDLTIY